MEIHWRNPNHLPTRRQLQVEERLEALGREDPALIDLWIDLQKSRHRTGGDSASIRCQARNAEIVVGADGDDVDTALQEALEQFENEVRRRRERLEDLRKPRPAAPAELAVVDRLMVDEGYGFLVTEGGEQVYFHRNALGDGLDFETLEVGQRVALSIDLGEKGPQATVVLPAPPDVPQ